MLRSCLEEHKYFQPYSITFFFSLYVYIFYFPEEWILCVGGRYQHGVVTCIWRINAEQEGHCEPGQQFCRRPHVTATHLLIVCVVCGHLVITGVTILRKLRNTRKCLPLISRNMKPRPLLYNREQQFPELIRLEQ